jgi:hypothetical protein
MAFLFKVQAGAWRRPPFLHSQAIVVSLSSICPPKNRRIDIPGMALCLWQANIRTQKRDCPVSCRAPGSDCKGNIPVRMPANVVNSSNLHTDPLVHHGRHFGRAVYAFANLHALIMFSLSADEDNPPETQQLRFYSLLSRFPSQPFTSEKEGS